MRLRIRLLNGLNALLYLGPLVAGMSGFGWGMVASFTAIFVVWLMLLHPERWPATRRDWQSGAAWFALLMLILWQVALIALLFALGRGIGAVAGFLPVVSPELPLGISFLAIPLGRMLWNPREAAEQGIFLDEEAEAANAPRIAAAAAASIVPLLNLPDEAPDAQTSAAVAAIMGAPTAGLRLKSLAAALVQPVRSHSALRRALILWATEPEIVAHGTVPGSMELAFSIADRNGDLLRLYVPRALALIAAFPDRATGFPTPDRLREVARHGLGSDPFSDLPAHLQADLREGLLALARAVERALPSGAAAIEARRERADHSTRTA